MKSFIKDFNRSLNGASFESSEVPPVVTEVVHEGPITQQDIDETHAHRGDVQDILEEIKELHSDAGDITTVTKAAQSVVSAVDNAEHITPAQAETYVNLANLGIDDASHLLQAEIPHLAEDQGRITSESMEGVMGWLASASKSVWNAAGKFFERVATGFTRLDKTSSGFHNRIARIQGKIKNRKGDGGKPLSLGKGVKALLVEGNAYVTPASGAGALKKFSDISLGIVGELEKYMLKVDSEAKKELMEAIIKNFDKGETIVDSGEFSNKIASLLNGQGDHLLGNVKYEFKETRNKSRILNCELVSNQPPASAIVKHLDAPVSLTSSEVMHLLGSLSEVVSHQTTSLQQIIKSTDSAFKQIRGVISNLTATNHDETGEEVPRSHDADQHRLIRLENGLVNELGNIAKAMTRHQGDLIERIDALLTLAEESVFQD